MNENEIIDVFRKSRALLNGHFVLRSGLHSRQFFQCALALQYMPTVERLAKALTLQLVAIKPITVVAPAMGGLVIGQEVARRLGVRFIFFEKSNDRLELRRGFKITEGERILIVEDVITRGGRVDESIAIIRKHGGIVEAVAVLVDRSGGKLDFGSPLFSLLEMAVETFDSNNIPDDLANIPAIKPGS